MRFCYVVLLATVALFAGSDGVTATTVAESEQVAQLDAVRSLREQNDIDIDTNRLLKLVDTEEEERSVPFSELKMAVWKGKITSWFSAKKTLTQVNRILLKHGGKVNWALATAYASYFRSMRYGPYALDTYNKATGSRRNA